MWSKSWQMLVKTLDRGRRSWVGVVLGQGGQSCLAACFLILLRLSLNDGVGLNYHFGLFQQVLKTTNRQRFQLSGWLEQNWLVRSSRSYQVPFCSLHSDILMILMPGYKTETKNRLLPLILTQWMQIHHYWQRLTLIRQISLATWPSSYPDDSDKKGNSSSGNLPAKYSWFQMVLSWIDEAIERQQPARFAIDYAVIQINDTHLVIPEMTRLLTERGLIWWSNCHRTEDDCLYEPQ